MIKSIFLNIIQDPAKRNSLNLLTNSHEAYEVFCENGYVGDFKSFEKELSEFLNSAEIQELVSHGQDELSDEMLAGVSGGTGALGRAIIGGAFALISAINMSSSSIATTFGGSARYNEPSVSISQSYDLGGHDQDSPLYQGQAGDNQDLTFQKTKINEGLKNQIDKLNKMTNHLKNEQTKKGNNWVKSESNDQHVSGKETSAELNKVVAAKEVKGSGDKNNNEQSANVNSGPQVIANTSDSRVPQPPPAPASPVFNKAVVAKETKGSGDQNKNGNEQSANVNVGAPVIANTSNPSVPPPPPPPSAPKGVNTAASGQTTNKNSNTQSQSMAEQIAQKAQKGSLKKVVKDSNQKTKAGTQKDLRAELEARFKGMGKESAIVAENKGQTDDKSANKRNSSQNLQVNVAQGAQEAVNVKGSVPPPPPAPKGISTAASGQAANKNSNTQSQSMAEQIAQKAKKGSLKKVVKDSNQKTNKKQDQKQGKNFLQSALSQALKIRHENIHMYDDANDDDADDDWD